MWIHSPFDQIETFVEFVQGLGDAEQLLLLVDGFLVRAAHDLEQSSEGEFQRSFLVVAIGSDGLEQTQQAIGGVSFDLLLGFLRILPLLFQFLFFFIPLKFDSNKLK